MPVITQVSVPEIVKTFAYILQTPNYGIDEHRKIADTIVKKMWEYQQKHNIINECIGNTTVFIAICKILKLKHIEPKAKAMMFLAKKKETSTGTMVCSGHMVVELKSMEKIEVSYEVNEMVKKEYYDNIADIVRSGMFKKDMIHEKLAKLYINGGPLKHTVKTHLEFKVVADEINDDCYNNDSYKVNIEGMSQLNYVLNEMAKWFHNTPEGEMMRLRPFTKDKYKVSNWNIVRRYFLKNKKVLSA